MTRFLTLVVPPRTLLKIDFLCAFSGAVIIYVCFDLMQEIFGVPRWMATIQLGANLGYGIFGSVLYALRKERTLGFRALVSMNFVYSFFCFASAVSLFFQELPLGAGILLFEAVLIFLLAIAERRTMKADSQGLF